MHGGDQEVIESVCGWLEAGRRAALITIARTFGSAPRPVGALMAVNDTGEWVGSVSGGCVETQLVARLRDAIPQNPRVVSFGVTKEDAQQHGLPCGGRLDVLVEGITSATPLRVLLDAMQARKTILRRVCLATGEVSMHAGERARDFFYDENNLEKVYGPQWRLLLIGAGQLSRFVAQMAVALDYDVIVCEPRADYVRQWNLPNVSLDSRMPDEVIHALASDARSAVLALTHDPKLDDLALIEALESSAFYVGALGSVATNAKRRERLRRMGVPDGAIARLHGPVGLPLGSKTPAEIAIAILAGLIAARHGVQLEARANETPQLQSNSAACRS